MTTVGKRIDDAIEGVRKVVDSAAKTAREEMKKQAPELSSALDRSFKQTAKSFSDALGTIDKGSSKQQRALLSTYKSFLQRQAEVIDKRLKDLEGKQP